MSYIKSFNRFELKYIVPITKVQGFKNDIQKYMEKDIHNKDDSYNISSLYFDSKDYVFYWEKIEGIKFRRKLRIRWYEDDGPITDKSPVYIEIKQRLDKVTQKRRVKTTYAEAIGFCIHGIRPKHTPEYTPVIDEIESILKTNKLQPVIIISYSREAYNGINCDNGLRITFDTNITYSYKEKDIKNYIQEDYVITPDKLIIEVKVNDRIPYWMTELIGKHNLKLIRISKYTQGLEKTTIVPKSFNYIT